MSFLVERLTQWLGRQTWCAWPKFYTGFARFPTHVLLQGGPGHCLKGLNTPFYWVANLIVWASQWGPWTLLQNGSSFPSKWSLWQKIQYVCQQRFLKIWLFLVFIILFVLGSFHMCLLGSVLRNQSWGWRPYKMLSMNLIRFIQSCNILRHQIAIFFILNSNL